MLLAEENTFEKAKTTCTYRFGFYADIRKSKWENAKEQLGKKLIQQYFSRIENKAAHNLCTYLTPPKNVENLLGLGLTFCIQPKHPKNNFSESFERFKYDIRTKYCFKDSNDNDEYEKKIYIKSDKWDPPDACGEIEDDIIEMEKELDNAIRKNKYRHSTNLTREEHDLLKEL